MSIARPEYQSRLYELAPMRGHPAILGEGPLWSPGRGLLFWLDINRRSLHSLDPSTGIAQVMKLDQPVTALAETMDGGMLAMAYKAVMRLEVQSGHMEPLTAVEPDLPDNRINDAACDRAGRLWLGTMQNKGEGACGSLYYLEPGGKPHRMDTGFKVSNGIGFSPDDRLLYFADTLAHSIYAYDFDIATGCIKNRRTFAYIPSGWGRPDGLTVDSEGYVWSALWDGAKVIRISPEGETRRVLDLKALRPTSCMFGGPDLDQLFITSAARDLSEDALISYPDSGALMMLKPGVAGLAEPKFGG